MREMLKVFAEELMGAEADAVCGAACGRRSGERANRRNGCRERGPGTRVGTIPLSVPKPCEGSCCPGWLLENRRRAERALVAVIAGRYVRGVSARRTDGLVKTLGIGGIPKPRVSRLARALGTFTEATGAAWQRCRARFMRNVLCRVPESAQPSAATPVRAIFAQPSAEEAAAQLARAAAGITAFSAFPDRESIVRLVGSVLLRAARRAAGIQALHAGRAGREGDAADPHR